MPCWHLSSIPKRSHIAYSTSIYPPSLSAIGADPHSPLRYFDTEAAIAALYYDSLQIAHPFLIIGERGDSRPVERSAAWLFDRTFGRRFSRFQPSDGKQIAAVMIEKA